MWQADFDAHGILAWHIQFKLLEKERRKKKCFLLLNSYNVRTKILKFLQNNSNYSTVKPKHIKNNGLRGPSVLVSSTNNGIY